MTPGGGGRGQWQRRARFHTPNPGVAGFKSAVGCTDIEGKSTPKRTPPIMFAPAAPSRNFSSASAGAYRTVGVETGVSGASPHQLVIMLFDGFNTAIAEARTAMTQGDVAAKCKAITRALRIVDEGLKAPLDAAGGAISDNLRALYGYVTLRLTQANLGNDAAALDECVKLLEPVRSAWLAIAPARAAAEVQ